MKESIGFSVSLNIMITFIAIVIAFLSFSLIYFKSNKVSNIITSAIEKYEGFNSTAKNEISMKLASIGYGSVAIDCPSAVTDEDDADGECKIQGSSSEQGANGYCVYKCEENNGEYFYYKIRTNMMFNLPVIHDILNIPIYSNTNRLYKF